METESLPRMQGLNSLRRPPMTITITTTSGNNHSRSQTSSIRHSKATLMPTATLQILSPSLALNSSSSSSFGVKDSSRDPRQRVWQACSVPCSADKVVRHSCNKVQVACSSSSIPPLGR